MTTETDADDVPYLEFLQVQHEYYDYDVPPSLVGGRDIAFRCRRLTLDEWLTCLDLSPGGGVFGLNIMRSGMEVIRLTLESIVSRKIDDATGEEKVTITPAAPLEKDDEGNAIRGDFDLDKTGIELRTFLAKSAVQQLWSEEVNAGED